MAAGAGDAAIERIEGLARFDHYEAEYALLELPSWEEAQAACAEAIDAIWRKTAYPAWVETRLDGRAAACTIIRYGGGTETSCVERLSGALAAAHSAAVSEAIQRRLRLIRLAAVALRVLPAIAAASANPALSIPALWNLWKLSRELRAGFKLLADGR